MNAIILIPIIIISCLTPVAWLLWLGHRKREDWVRREMLEWDAASYAVLEQRAAELGAARAVPIIMPAIFPATMEERRDLEASLPGYKFVDPVSEKDFAIAAKRKRTDHAGRKAERLRAQTIADVVADAESRN